MERIPKRNDPELVKLRTDKLLQCRGQDCHPVIMRMKEKDFYFCAEHNNTWAKDDIASSVEHFILEETMHPSKSPTDGKGEVRSKKARKCMQRHEVIILIIVVISVGALVGLLFLSRSMS